MRGLLLVVGLVCLASALAQSGGPALAPASVYFSEENAGRLSLLAPGVVVAGEVLDPPWESPRTASAPSNCSALCRSNPECSWFRYCDAQAGCRTGEADLAFQQCQLLATNCSLQPTVLSTNAGRVTSGFPVPLQPVVVQGLSGFSPFEGQGILNGDYECPESLIPGACGLRDTLTAASTCLRMPDCRAVVVLRNGTDGCSDPVSLLKTAGLSPANGFISPAALTLQVAASRADASSFWLLAEDGEVVLAPEAAAPSDPRGILFAPTAWLGYIQGRNSVMAGVVLRTLDGMGSAESCARACHGYGTAAQGPSRCTAFNFCDRPAGCAYQDRNLNRERVQLRLGQCELRHQDLAEPGVGSPPVLLGKGDDVPFTSGAPLAVWGPQLAGYQRYIGQSLYAAGRYDCEGSLRPQAGECVLEGGADQLAALCRASSPCRAFLLKPGFIVNGQPLLQRVGVLKQRLSPPAAWVLTPTTVMYVRQPDGGLSSGAIAGIVVGAVAGSALLAGAVWLLLARQQRAARRLAAGGSASSGAVALQKGVSSIDVDEGGAGGDAVDADAVGAALPWAVKVAPQQGGAPASLASPFVSNSSKGSGGSIGGSIERTAAVAGVSFWQRGPTAVQPFPGAAGRGPLSPATDPLAFDPAVCASGMLSSSNAMSPVLSAAAAASLARAQACSDETGSDAPDSGGGDGSGLAGEAPLAELVQHVAAHDAALQTAGGASSTSSADAGLPLLSVEALPPRLREWVVAPSEFTPLRWPNGKVQEVGAGASAHVYKVLFNGEVVAAKEMDLEASAAMQEAFLKEAVWLHALRHPNIVAFYGCCIAGSRGIVLMELCEGRDLHSALPVKAAGSSQRLFCWQRRGRRVAYEVAKALNYLHSKGVVHMDIKSSNVLLTANGAVRVSDVGFSRQKTHTVLSNVPLVGTFAWIAPEILTGKQHCTERVDIFSMGVVMWEIITGERPQRGNLRAPRVPEECPQDVADLLAACLSEDPDDRPSAAQLLQRLNQFLERPKPAVGASHRAMEQ